MPKTEPGSDLFFAAPLPVAVLDDEQRINCLRLIRTPNVGPASFRTLINQFGSAGAALDALPDLARRGGRRGATAGAVYPRDRAMQELATATRIGARPVFTIEPGYPALLAATEAPPPLIYIKGNDALFARPAVAVVGSRDCSAAGREIACRISRGLAEAGYVINSGLARGIDGTAHRTALATGTIAVLAGGADFVYPPEHADLMDEIAATGALVTEQPPGFKPRAADFPRRNRIISGMSLGVVIIEAASRSGTLVTARYAAEQGREVFAVPGNPLDPRAAGTNRLIQNGATLVTSSDDIAAVLAPIAGLTETPARPFNAVRSVDEAGPSDGRDANGSASTGIATRATTTPDVDDTQRHSVWTALGPAPVSVDAILRATGLEQRHVHIVLLELELAGRLARPGPGLVARAIPTADD